MSDITKPAILEVIPPKFSPAEKQAARQTVASWCARNSLGSEAVRELLDELGLA